jgi:hypothetical protein
MTRIHEFEPKDVAAKGAVRLSIFAVDNYVSATNHFASEEMARNSWQTSCVPWNLEQDHVRTLHNSGSPCFRAHSCRDVERVQEFEAGLSDPMMKADAEPAKVFVEHAEDQLVTFPHFWTRRESETINPQAQSFLKIFTRNNWNARLNRHESSFSWRTRYGVQWILIY